MSDASKSRIFDALKELLQGKDLDKVTVRELVERCGLSRQGFYYHFQDIADVLKWKISWELERGMERGLHAKSLEEPLVAMAKTMEEHGVVLRNLMRSTKLRDRLMPVLIDAVQENVRPLLHRYIRADHLDAGRRELLITFLAYGIVGIVAEKSGESGFTPEFIVREIELLLEARFASASRDL